VARGGPASFRHACYVASVTRYEFFRRRIAPIAFLCVVGLIAYDACQKQQRNHATIVIDLGAAEPRVTSVEAELIVGGEPIGMFRRAALPGAKIGPCRFETAMPDADGDLRIEVGMAGATRKLTRHVHAEEGATVTISIGAELER
jgi:hypothetical protein